MATIKKIDKKNKFMSFFNTETGAYIRTGELEVTVNDRGVQQLHDTGIDPFMTSFPELIDIGIMARCINGESGKCTVQCYQNAIGRNNKNNMTLEEYTRLIKQCKDKTFQVALGGAGDVDTHENFEEILKVTKEHNIVPNFTTSGIAMTKRKAEICKKYCGAVAVSSYGKPVKRVIRRKKSK